MVINFILSHEADFIFTIDLLLFSHILAILHKRLGVLVIILITDQIYLQKYVAQVLRNNSYVKDYIEW